MDMQVIIQFAHIQTKSAAYSTFHKKNVVPDFNKLPYSLCSQGDKIILITIGVTFCVSEGGSITLGFSAVQKKVISIGTQSCCFYKNLALP